MKAKSILSVKALDGRITLTLTDANNKTVFDADGVPEEVTFNLMNGEELLDVQASDSKTTMLDQVNYILRGRLIDDDTAQPMLDSTIDYFCRTDPYKAMLVAGFIRRESDKRVKELVDASKTAKNFLTPVVTSLT